jgi:histidinol-phosphate aminotransferase
MTYERAHLQQMKGYVPGAQPRGDAIKLNTNENPYPPSVAVMAALAMVSARALQRYPDPTAQEFRRAAANLHHLALDQVVATNGGDELLRLALTTFAEPTRPIGLVTPSYGLYSVLAAIHQAPLSAVPLTETWQLPDDTAERWNTDGAQLAIVANPHAPSGALTPIAAIERLAATFRGVLVVDEAYVDFADPALDYDATKLIARYPNLLLLRTLSKGYSLAGLRLGYGLGNAELVAPILELTKDSYNVDAIAQILGTVALTQNAYARSSWEAVRKGRADLTRKLDELGFDVAASQANFLLVSVPADAGWGDAQTLHAKLAERRIYVRWFDEDRLRDRLRVSIGTPEENAVLVGALQEIHG